jgi:hypothetical protein
MIATKAERKRTPPERQNTYGLPRGEPIRKQLRVEFRRQRDAILKAIGAKGRKDQGDPLEGLEFDDFRLGTLAMSERMTPLLEPYWDDAGRDLRTRIGLDPNAWEVTDPNTRAKIEQAAFDFCAATNETTVLELGEARDALRAELVAGVVDRGDTLAELTKRVQAVFKDAETWRARRIAQTEASRAVHAGLEESARQSGVVAGLEWLASGDACPKCLRIAAEVNAVPLGTAFAVESDHPSYGLVRYPPAHPHCNCSCIEILLPEYGGPVLPGYGSAIDLRGAEA